MQTDTGTIENATGRTLIRLTQVRRKVPYCRATIYALIADGKFPKPISLGGRAVAWVESEVDEWVTAKIRAARGEGEAA